MKRLARALRTYVITGLLVLLPLAVTFYLIALVFSVTDTLLGSLTEYVFGRRIPGAGVVLTVIVIIGAGIIATNVLGRRVIHFFEGLLTRIPLVRPIYNAVKQLVNAFTLESRSGMKEVVLVPFPGTNVRSVGFVTNERPHLLARASGEDVVTVFVPTVPNPTTGFFLAVPRHDVVPLGVTLEEGFKMMMSAGAIMPERPDATGSEPSAPSE